MLHKGVQREGKIETYFSDVVKQEFYKEKNVCVAGKVPYTSKGSQNISKEKYQWCLFCFVWFRGN